MASEKSGGADILDFSALSGFLIDGVTASGVSGVTAGGTMSETFGVLTSTGFLKSSTGNCPTEAAGVTGTVADTITFAPVNSSGFVDFGFTFASNIGSGGSGTLESSTWQLSLEPLPEPATLVLVGFGLLALGAAGRRRSRRV